MKALYYQSYGSPDVLRIKDLKKPIPRPKEILVKVHCTTVNRTDCAAMQAHPFINRFVTGLFSPRRKTPGTDFAGMIEKAGAEVKRFKTGDRVFGFHDLGISSQAEYMVMSEDKPISKIPKDMSFEEATACPEGLHYAFNFVNKVNINPGDKVLVNGATGAIGSAAVQLCTYFGAEVTAVCAGEYASSVKGLGAYKIIDYLREDFTRSDQQFDFIFDAVGKRAFFKCRRILKPHGTYISSELGPFAQNLWLALFTPVFGGRKVVFPFPVNIPKTLDLICSMYSKGKFKPLIDKTYPFEKAQEAYEYVCSGKKVGNVILSFEK